MASLKYDIARSEDLFRVLAIASEMAMKGLQAGPITLTLGRPSRSDQQNKKMWSMLRDISTQVEWHGQRLSDEDWKHMFSAIIENQRVVPGLEGGFVVLGCSTRKKNKKWFSDLFELMNAFGAERGVRWKDESQ